MKTLKYALVALIGMGYAGSIPCFFFLRFFALPLGFRNFDAESHVQTFFYESLCFLALLYGVIAMIRWLASKVTHTLYSP